MSDMQIRRLASVLLCAATCFGTDCAQATLIVVAYDEANIYIAADSRIGRSGKSIDGICKIKQVGPWFMARAGFFETGLSDKTIQDRLVEADTTGRNLPDALQSLRPVIAKEFTSLVQGNKREYPQTYKEIVSRRTDELANVLLCGFKSRKPSVELTFWKLRFDTNHIPFVTAETELFPPPAPGQLGFQVLGQNGAIRKAMQENPNFLARQGDDPLKLLRHCAQLELESLPSNDSRQGVGIPIDILHITPERAEWIQKKPECVDIVPYWKSEQSGQQNGAANGSQPIRSETNSTSSAAGSRR